MNNDLAEIIAVAVAAAMAEIKCDDGLWSAKTIAKYMDMDCRTVLSNYAPHPDFPKSVRAPVVGGGRGQPRWKAVEIRAWWNKHQEDSCGRRRARDG